MPKGAQSCRAPSEKLRTLLKLSQQRVRRWGYLLTNFHFSLVEGYSQAGPPLPGTLGGPVGAGHAPVTRQSPQQMRSCPPPKDTDTPNDLQGGWTGCGGTQSTTLTISMISPWHSLPAIL